MKKLQLLFMASIMSVISVNAQFAESGPDNGGSIESSNALFDLLYTIDVGANGSVGANGLAGVIFINGQYWVSAWQSDLIHLLDSTGAFIETFVVQGVTGARSFTTDGTWIYIGTAGTTIYEVDPVLRIINAVISVTTTSNAEARMCTYDETLDGGAGGFWIGDFGSDIASITKSGLEISVIPSNTHLTAIYGGAVDNISPGGPFLWISDQTGVTGDPDRNFLTQLALPSGVPTGVQYDFFADGMASGSTDVLAGGLYISDQVSPSAVALVGLCQCSPSNTIYAVELLPTLGVNENDISNFTLYPNPASRGVVNVETSTPGEKQVVVMDILGKTVINTTISGTELNIASLKGGVYMVQVTQNNATATRKLIVN